MTETASPRPLEGLRVIDMTRALAGPYATLLLAGLGAEVIKVEDPRGGDMARDNSPYLGRDGVTVIKQHADDLSVSHLTRGRGKHGVSLNLKAPEARDVFADLAFLERAGARLSFFSPLRDAELPDCDALWLPGGYPELHLTALSANRPMIEAIRAHFSAGRPILAECGGMLYACERLTDAAGGSAPMLGLLPARATMQKRLVALGMQEAELHGHAVRGHTFHYSQLDTTLAPIALAQTPDGRKGERIFRQGPLTASYMHFYFPFAPELVADLLLGQSSLGGETGPSTPANRHPELVSGSIAQHVQTEPGGGMDPETSSG